MPVMSSDMYRFNRILDLTSEEVPKLKYPLIQTMAEHLFYSAYTMKTRCGSVDEIIILDQIINKVECLKIPLNGNNPHIYGLDPFNLGWNDIDRINFYTKQIQNIRKLLEKLQVVEEPLDLNYLLNTFDRLERNIEDEIEVRIACDYITKYVIKLAQDLLKGEPNPEINRRIAHIASLVQVDLQKIPSSEYGKRREIFLKLKEKVNTMQKALMLKNMQNLPAEMKDEEILLKGPAFEQKNPSPTEPPIEGDK